MLTSARVGIGICAVLYLVSVLALAITVQSGRASQGWSALLQELSLYVFLPLPFLAVAGLVLRARTALACGLGPVLLFLSWYGPQFAPSLHQTAHGPSVRVFSLNVGAARGFGRPDRVVGAIRATNPDVVVLVEARETAMETIGASLSSTYPYRAGSTSVFIFSRLPISAARPGLLHSGAHDSLLADIQVGGRRVTFAAVHLLRIETYPGLGRGVRPLARVGTEYRTDQRDAAVAELAADLNRLDGPVVLAGDFNMTASSRSYALLTAHLHDSFLETGWGFGHTYPTTLRSLDLSLPLLRIDYIFHSDGLDAVRTWVGPDGGSDHLPVIADLALR